MPLSEHEQRLLEQMERALYAEDPKFATSLQNSGPRRGSRKRMLLGLVVGLVGLALLITGVAVKMEIVGIVGFVTMLAGAVLAFTGGTPAASEAQTGDAPAAGKAAKRGKAKAKPEGGFMGRLEDRWRNRREGDDL